MDLKLRRTRFRGVFQCGERYVVPYYDEVGVEHRKEFHTREEARSFRWTVRFAEKQQSEYTRFPDGAPDISDSGWVP